MTEAEWDKSDVVTRLAWAHGHGASARKLRLYEVAGCRRIWGLLADERSKGAVIAAERYADGHVGEAERGAAEAAGEVAYSELRSQAQARNEISPDGSAILGAAAAACGAVRSDDLLAGDNDPYLYSFLNPADAAVLDLEARGISREAAMPGEVAAHTVLILCIFGNPFRPVAVDPSWLTPTVVALAGGIYADRAFDRLPVLADALQDAGCEHPDVLAHCRGPGPHARGCWVVDLLLGKA